MGREQSAPTHEQLKHSHCKTRKCGSRRGFHWMPLSFARPAILNASHCDRNIKAVCLNLKLIQMNEGTTKRIADHPDKRTASQTPLSNGLEYLSAQSRMSPLVLVVSPIVIPSKSHMWVYVRTKRIGFVGLEPIATAYGTHSISVPNIMHMVELNVPFLGLVTNFGDTSKQLKNTQKIELVRSPLIRLIPTDLNIADILGATQESMDKTTLRQQIKKVDIALQITYADQQTKTLDTLDLPYSLKPVSRKATHCPAHFRLSVKQASERNLHYKTKDWYRSRGPTCNATSILDSPEGAQLFHARGQAAVQSQGDRTSHFGIGLTCGRFVKERQVPPRMHWLSKSKRRNDTRHLSFENGPVNWLFKKMQQSFQSLSLTGPTGRFLLQMRTGTRQFQKARGHISIEPNTL